MQLARDPFNLEAQGKRRVELFATSDAFARFAASLFISDVHEALTRNPEGEFHVVLSGGRTPLAMYRELPSHELYDDIDWKRVHVYWGDERDVDFTSAQSNFGEAWRNWLFQAPVPRANLHPFRTELGPELAAREMARHLPRRFDLTFLGLGKDGHTASLFPENPWPESPHSSPTLALSVWVPHLQEKRLTLSPQALARSTKIVFLVSGAEKADILLQVLKQDPLAPEALPAARIQPAPRGEVIWLADLSAVPKTNPAIHLRRPVR